MAGTSHAAAVEDRFVIDAQLYRFLVTGKMDDFRTAVLGKQVDRFRYPRDNNNVLHIAASFGHEELVAFILEQWPGLFFKGNSKGDLALHSAIKAGRLHIVDAFIQWLNQLGNKDEAIKKAFEWNENADRNTALHIALENNDEQLAQLLVDIHPPALYFINKTKSWPLYLAIRLEMKDLVVHMLRKSQKFKKDTDRCLREGKSVLQALIYANNLEMLQHMLDYDAQLINSIDKEGKTALSYAAYKGDLEKACLLFQAKPNSAFTCDQDGSYPIHQAVLGGHADVIKLLASSKFLLNAKGENIIHLAVLAGNPNLVFYLLDTMPEMDSLINQKDDDGNTPLHLATLTKHIGVVELLIQDVRVKVGVLNKEELTANDLAKKLMLDNKDISVARRLNNALVRAKSGTVDDELLELLYNGDVNQFSEVLLQRGVQIKDLGCLKDGNNILHIAARMDKLALINKVIDCLHDQFDIFMEQANSVGDLPIHVATKAGKLGSLKALLERSNIPAKGICERMNMKGNTPLHIAVLNNHMQIVNYLYEICQKAAYCLNKDNICPLFLAINYCSKSDLVIQMIEGLDKNTSQNDMQGAKSIIHAAIVTQETAILESIVEIAPLLKDLRDNKGRSPLSYAAHIGNFEVVKFFLDRFPDLEFKRDGDEEGSFPIHQAAKGGKLNILKQLLHPEYCLVNSKDQNILHVAAETGRKDVVEYLLTREEFKELINTGDEDGNTPLHLAIKGRSYNVVHVLNPIYPIYQFEPDKAYTNVNALNNELLTAGDMFHQQLQYPGDPKLPLTTLQIDVIESMLDGRRLVSTIKGSGRDNEKEMKKKQAEAEDKASVASNTKPAGLSYIDRANAFLVVTALVITATFAAALTPPGGFHQETGIPLLLNKPGFNTFVQSNNNAFTFAVSSAISIILGTIVPRSKRFALASGGFFLFIGLVSMSISFTAGLLTTNQVTQQKTALVKLSTNKFMLFHNMAQVITLIITCVFVFTGTRRTEVLIRRLFCALWPLPQRKTHINFTI